MAPALVAGGGRYSSSLIHVGGVHISQLGWRRDDARRGSASHPQPRGRLGRMPDRSRQTARPQPGRSHPDARSDADFRDQIAIVVGTSRIRAAACLWCGSAEAARTLMTAPSSFLRPGGADDPMRGGRRSNAAPVTRNYRSASHSFTSLHRQTGDRVGTNSRCCRCPLFPVLVDHINSLIFLVRTAGLEPALPCGKQILSLLRLPFRHVRCEVSQSSRNPSLGSPPRARISAASASVASSRRARSVLRKTSVTPKSPRRK
jgi:hypothetical protein